MDLTTRQQALLEEWLPGAVMVCDHSWGLVGTTVLELRLGEASYIVKAGDEADHHLGRELRAHHEWLRPWVQPGPMCRRMVTGNPATGSGTRARSASSTSDARSCARSSLGGLLAGT